MHVKKNKNAETPLAKAALTSNSTLDLAQLQIIDIRIKNTPTEMIAAGPSSEIICVASLDKSGIEPYPSPTRKNVAMKATDICMNDDGRRWASSAGEPAWAYRVSD